MSFGQFRVPTPKNEPVLDYAPHSAERVTIEAELKRQRGATVEIAPRIGGQSVKTGDLRPIVMPHEHGHRLGQFHAASKDEVEGAIAAAERARPQWAAMPWEERAAVFLRAAVLLQGPYRDRLNAATMLGQSKTVHQAEIDAACELIDFFNFNAHYLAQIMAEQPLSPTGVWNRLEYRPLDGFVFAISPFNFTSIAGNLSAAAAICGNTVVWKPASTSVLSGSVVMDLLDEAGLPPGVINFVPGDGATVGDAAIASRHLAGVHFTGSTGVFQSIWGAVGRNIKDYGQYPRLVGETGGKDFVVVHSSANVEPVVTALARGAFEYQGQKCSAASRAYIPSDLWPQVREQLAAVVESIPMGDISDFGNFMGAVIDAKSFAKQKGAITEAQGAIGGDVTEVIGGQCDDSVGYFVRPTVIVTSNPRYRTMQEELFGPVLTIYVYDPKKYEDVLRLVDETSTYALTGAIFANDRSAVVRATEILRHAAGNFYINDKPTGAVVGQQPFGGSRASGTNDKAGSLWNLIRWLSPRTIKETFDPPRTWQYPFMG